VTVAALPFVVQALLWPPGEGGDADVYRAEARYVTPVAVSAPGQAVWNVLRGVCAENMVGPSPIVVQNAEQDLGVRMGSYAGLLNRACAAAWLLALIAAACVVIIRRDAHRPTLWAALFCLLGSAALHTFYGNDHIFLFSCTFTFCVVAVAAHGLATIRSRWRTTVVAGVGLLVLVNNVLFCGQILDALDRINEQQGLDRIVASWPADPAVAGPETPSQSDEAGERRAGSGRNSAPRAVETISKLPRSLSPCNAARSTVGVHSCTAAAPRSTRLTRPCPALSSPS
jgi:hypothetical protein